jgi:dCTP deaminase
LQPDGSVLGAEGIDTKVTTDDPTNKGSYRQPGGSIISRDEIERRLDLPVTNDENLVITPLFDRESVLDSDSIDLRLGTHFLLPRLSQRPFLSPDKESTGTFHSSFHVPLGKFLVVPAHQTVLGSTLEFIRLPYDLSGEILTKSSVARTFIVIETAPWVHPEYRGCLTLEIANVSNTPILLYPGRAIGQLVLMRVYNPVKQKQLKETYFGPVYPESPKFNNPADDLAAIGIKTTWVLQPPRPKDPPPPAIFFGFDPET